jgi:hypothetical protein
VLRKAPDHVGRFAELKLLVLCEGEAVLLADVDVGKEVLGAVDGDEGFEVDVEILLVYRDEVDTVVVRDGESEVLDRVVESDVELKADHGILMLTGRWISSITLTFELATVNPVLYHTVRFTWTRSSGKSTGT